MTQKNKTRKESFDVYDQLNTFLTEQGPPSSTQSSSKPFIHVTLFKPYTSFNNNVSLGEENSLASIKMVLILTAAVSVVLITGLLHS